jgi:hypothetical protein
MSNAKIDRLLEGFQQILRLRGLKLLAVSVDMDSRHVGIELCRGPEISLQARFNFTPRSRSGVLVQYGAIVRWPRAEEIARDLRGESPYAAPQLLAEGMSPEAVDMVFAGRRELYPVATFVFRQADSFFPGVAPDAFELVPTFLAHAADVFRSRFVPEFWRFCDPDNLAQAATSSTNESHLSFPHLNAGIVLVAAGREQEFAAWRKAYRPPQHAKVEAKRRIEQELATLGELLSK